MADITLTNAQNAAAATSFLIMQKAGRELPFPARYALGKIQRKVMPEFEDYEKARMALCAQHAVQGDDGKPQMLANGAYDILDMAAFTAALQPILDETVTISGVRKVKVAEMGDVKLTDVELDGLLPFLEDTDG